MQFTHTYNALNAAQDGPLGFGWADNYNMVLTTDATGTITVTEEGGTSVTFAPTGAGYQPPSRVLATLVNNGDGTLTFTRRDQNKYMFTAPTRTTAGQLLKEVDRNGYATTLAYTNGKLSSVTDAAGRALTLAYNAAGRLASVADPSGRTVSFQYDASGNLTTATDVAGGLTRFTYDGSHRLLTMTDPKGGVVSNVYDGVGRVVSQTDAMGRTTAFTYTANSDGSQTTTITDALGNVTVERFDSNVLIALTKGSGTPRAATWTYSYDPATLGVAAVTDPDGHTWRNTWDSRGNLLSSTDPLKRTTTYTYDLFNDVTSVTDPTGVTTRLTYDTRGNLLSIARPVGGSGAGGAGPHAMLALRRAPSPAVVPASRRHAALSAAGPLTVPVPAQTPFWTTWRIQVQEQFLRKPPAAWLRYLRAHLPMASAPATSGMAPARRRRHRPVFPATLPLPASGVITTVAGSYTGDGGPAAQAALHQAESVAVDGAGNIFIADSEASRVREIIASTGLITTVAGTGVAGFSGDGGPATQAQLNHPYGIAVDGAGDLFFTDLYNQRVRKIAAGTGIISTVAGTGGYGYNGDGIAATQATLASPVGLAVDSAGDLFIADQNNNRVREVLASTGVITTVAGTGTAGSSGDGGPARQAQLNGPLGVALAGAGNLYVSDNTNNRVREVIASTGVITTVAGGGTNWADGIAATQAALAFPDGVAVDGSGNLFIADAYSNRVREVLASTGVITTVAGTGVEGYSGDGGAATAAWLAIPVAVALDGSGNLIFSDRENNRLRKVVASNTVITTLAGGYTGDGGPAAQGALSTPTGVSVDGAANPYIGDVGNQRVREVITSTGLITTVAGTGSGAFGTDGVPALQSSLKYPYGVAVDGAGNVFEADAATDRVREVIASTGLITTVAGSGTRGYSGDGGPATQAEVNSPQAVAVDLAGNLFIADTGNDRVRKVAVGSGLITTVAGTGSSGYSGDGGPASQAALGWLGGLAVDSAGNLFIADSGNNRVREVLASTGVITTVAGTGTAGASGDGGPATQATLNAPYGLALDGAGNLFIGDAGSNRVREIVASTGVITTVAGTGANGYSGDGGPATQATLNAPRGVALDGIGTLYVADTYSNHLRVVGGLGHAAACPPPSAGTAITCLAYDPAHPGDVIALTDPDGHTSHFAYDAFGDLSSASDPLSNTTTYSYDVVGRLTGVVSPRGNVSGATPISYTTTITANAFGDTTAITYALGHATTFQYDANRNLLAVTDALGHSTSYGYDAANERTSVTRPDGGLFLTGYDGDGNVITQTDALGRTTRYAYDALNRLLSRTDPLSRTTAYGYDGAGNVITVTDPLSHSTLVGYDAANEPVSLTRPDGGVWSSGYDADGRVITQTDPLSHSTTYAYDALSWVITVTDPLSRVSTVSYDLAGNRLALTDPLGRSTRYGYDAAGELTTVTRPDGSLLSTGYDADGNVITQTDPLGHSTVYGYDVLDRLTASTDPLSHTTAYGYDAVGNLLSVSTPLGHTTAYTYDALNRVLTVTDPLTHTTSYGYDLVGNVITQTDPLSHSTLYGYDGANEQTSLTRADGSVLRTGYDAAGNVISQTNGLSQSTRYGYDALNRVITTTDPLTRSTVYSYDLAGNQSALRDALGRTAAYTYDADNELTTITYALTNTPNVTFTYTASGQRASMADGSGTSTYQYDALDRPLTVTTGAGQRVGYGYDLAGNLSRLSYPDGSQVTRSYDAANRLTGITDWLGHTTSLAYDADGNVITQTDPNTTTAAFSYNGADQLTAIVDSSAGSPLWSYSYGRDALGQLRSSADPLEGQQHSYHYTPLNQLSSDQQVSGTLSTTSTWSLDAADEITQTVSQTVGASSPTTSTLGYDGANELSSLSSTGASRRPAASRSATAPPATASARRIASAAAQAVMAGIRLTG